MSAVDILTEEGRIVGGHPLFRRAVVDNKTKQPVFNNDGTPATDVYIALAIPKTQGVDWKQTPWGKLIVAAATAGWVNSEIGSPSFAWKVTNGDSTVPNTKGKKPCDREGYPGNWVLQCSTRLNVSAFHVGNYDPMAAIQDTNEIKPGDYGRLSIQAKANIPSESPGVYLNPRMFELTRAGAHIDLSDGPSAADVFGGGGAIQQPTQAGPTPPDTNVAAATDFLNGGGPKPPEVKYIVEGKQYTEAQLAGWNWTPQQIAACPKA